MRIAIFLFSMAVVVPFAPVSNCVDNSPGYKGLGMRIAVTYYDSDIDLLDHESAAIIRCAVSALKERLPQAGVYYADPSVSDLMGGRFNPPQHLSVHVSWDDGWFSGEYMTVKMTLSAGGYRVWKSKTIKSEFTPEDACPKIREVIMEDLKTP